MKTQTDTSATPPPSDAPDISAFAVADEKVLADLPAGVDRRSFLMRSAVISSAVLITGRSLTPEARAQAAAAPPSKPQVPLSPSFTGKV